MSKKLVSDNESRKKLGEVTTYPYSLFVRRQDKPPGTKVSDIIPKQDKRKDGRKCSEHRKIYMRCGVVEDARGSSYIEMGGTKVIASVTGPVEMPQNMESEEKGFLNCEVKFSQFSCKSRDEVEELGTAIETVTDGLNRALEPAVIKEDLGNIQLNVIVAVVESDGNIVSACVIAACLAIANGRIPMNDLVASVTMAVLSEDLQLMDPTEAEEEFALTQRKETSSHGLLSLSYMASTDEATDFVLSGKLEVETILPILPILKEKCTQIYNKMQRVLKKDVKQMLHGIITKNNKEKEQEATTIVREELAKLST